jgi:hypothetical protein
VNVVPKEVEPKKTNGMASNIAITISLLPERKALSVSNIYNSSFEKLIMIHKKKT